MRIKPENQPAVPEADIWFHPSIPELTLQQSTCDIIQIHNNEWMNALPVPDTVLTESFTHPFIDLINTFVSFSAPLLQMSAIFTVMPLKPQHPLLFCYQELSLWPALIVIMYSVLNTWGDRLPRRIREIVGRSADKRLMIDCIVQRTYQIDFVE